VHPSLQASRLAEAVENILTGAGERPRAADDGELVLYTDTAEETADTAQPPGLGSIQPNGRAQVLMEWMRPEAMQSQVQQPPGGRRLSEPPPRSCMLRPSPQGAAGAGGAGSGQETVEDLEWSNLSEASRQAVRQWASGQVGGRHCLLVLEHGGGGDSVVAPEEPSMSDLRSGAALNVLSGLHAEVGIIGGQEGGWLFEAVFARPPQQVLEEALQAALVEIGDPSIARLSDLSTEQANLALRRLGMKAHAMQDVPQLARGGGPCPGPNDEFMRMQVWLELVRLHVREGLPREGASGPAFQAAVSSAGKDKEKAARDRVAERPFHDGGILRELGKGETDLEAESQQMSLEVLRAQNRSIEEYVMRLVRQRDELKQVTKLAEEQDSYFILGLGGPDATEDEVKKAYRNLARKEHPDKAGIANKRRFQAIQQAYTSVLRQRREGGSCSVAPGEEVEQKVAEQAASTTVIEAANRAAQARQAADRVAACAHRAMRGSDEANEAQNLPKRRALKILGGLTRQGVADLRIAAVNLRTLGEAACSVAKSAEDAMTEHRDLATMSVAGIGLRDRATIVEDAGSSSIASAELLEKISEATEATLKKVEKASPDLPGGSDGAGSRGSTRGGGDEAANLLRLGARLMGESLARIAAVTRRSADEAIGGAMKALELSRGFANLDNEARKEREKEAAKKRGSCDDDEPVVAPDAEEQSSPSRKDGRSGTGASAEAGGASASTARTPRSRPETAKSHMETPRDQLKSAAKRVKDRHVSLRVKNLRFLTTLNEEAMRYQVKLCSLLQRSQGALLPEVTVEQKRRLFDLVTQVMDFALTESVRFAANPSAPPVRILDRALGFALALEHTKDIAVPVDSRTQALKLAALVDKELLCQVLDGPFRRKLLAAGRKGRAASESVSADRGIAAYGRSRSSGMGASAAAAASLKAWDEAAHAVCTRIAYSVRQVGIARPPEEAAAGPT